MLQQCDDIQHACIIVSRSIFMNKDRVMGACRTLPPVDMGGITQTGPYENNMNTFDFKISPFSLKQYKCLCYVQFLLNYDSTSVVCSIEWYC